MKRVWKLSFVLVFILMSTSGCWNLKEPNQRAFNLGSGLDLTEDGKFELSTLLAIPAGTGIGGSSGGKSNKESSTVVSAIGKNDYDATQNLQRKISRVIFPGHREIVLIGEQMAEHGIANLVDEFFRNPLTEMRSRAFVVKDGRAKDILSIDSYFDPFITTTLLDESKTLGLKEDYFRNFMSDALSEGVQPTLPTIGLNPKNHYTYKGSAIFNKDNKYKLVGYLGPAESFYANWIKGSQTYSILTSNVRQGNGEVSLRLTSINKKIKPIIEDKKIHIIVYLTGKGSIVENNTNLDPSNDKDYKLIQKDLNQIYQMSIQKMVKKVQKKYKMDIFRFGEKVHQEYPHQWKSLKKNWDETFSQLNVSVKVNVQFDSGISNSSLKSRY